MYMCGCAKISFADFLSLPFLSSTTSGLLSFQHSFLFLLFSLSARQSKPHPTRDSLSPVISSAIARISPVGTLLSRRGRDLCTSSIGETNLFGIERTVLSDHLLWYEGLYQKSGVRKMFRGDGYHWRSHVCVKYGTKKEEESKKQTQKRPKETV